MPAVPFKVKAIYEYRSDEPDDLNFENGQIITVTEEEDADWYTGEYVDASGEKRQGLFPRNFVEKYEPTVPSRPVRAPRRAQAPEPSERVQDPPPPQSVPPPAETYEAAHEEEKVSIREPAETARVEPEAPPPAPKPQPVAPIAPATVPTSAPTAARAPPPVAEKPSSSSFKDRIAAFNKPAAAPIAPFKPGGGGPSSGFIKKPFVAPPPSRNAFVPPPAREPPIQKPYRREDDASVNGAEPRDQSESTITQPEPEGEEQPKPQSLKERIALLQRQQLEQAARNAEKKEKPKKPPKKRVETAEPGEHIQPPEPALTRLDSNETVGRPSAEVAEGEHDTVGLPRRTTGLSTTGLSTPQPASRELVSDTNDADDSGAADDDDVQETSTEEERPKSKGTDIPIPAAIPRKSMDDDREHEGEKGEEEEEEEEEEDEEEDPEIRRRRELRDRMAKMSGGMGMMGMFGPPGGIGLPGAARKPKSEPSRQASESHPQEDSQERTAPVRIMALPGMSPSIPRRQEEPLASPESDEDETARPTPQEPGVQGETEDYVSKPLQRRSTDRSAPPVPQDRVAPPPPARDARGVPPPPPSGPRAAPPVPQSPTARSVPPPPPSLSQATPETPGYEEEDEANESPEEEAREAPETPAGAPALPPMPPVRPPEHSTLDIAESSMSSTTDKRASRPPPPIPMSPTSPQARAPPPPPPGAPPSRRSTTDSRGFATVHSPRPDVDDEDEVTEYDGDYDTDIASSAKHKDALKAHNRDSSLDEGALTDDMKSPKHAPTRAAPPLPPVNVPRDMPPPPPSLPTPKSRRSMDAPRAAPPPVPPPKGGEDDEYDPYRYSAPQHPPPPLHTKTPYSTSLQSPREELEEDDMYSAMPQQPSTIPPPPAERPAPPPPLAEPAEYVPSPTLAPPPPTDSHEQGTDLRRSGTLSRRSMDHSRGSSEQGYIAQDIDLGKGSMWWTQDNVPPPSLQGRPDVLYEMETGSSAKRGGRTTISKDIYVLYMDYSQTTINVSYDAAEPTHVTLEQNHGRPPPAPRRDQLENASAQYGNQIARVASGLSGTTVGDGSARSFVLELLKPHPTALLPVGTRAYGALVYSNLGNASTQQFDEIRPGDIVTFRNAKFSGHKGGLHQKYSVDVGKPEHVAVVIDWDGTKKKIRAWEQGRDLEKGKKPKVREESFKVGDLKSGEVMVWRVMPRTWVNWDTTKS